MKARCIGGIAALLATFSSAGMAQTDRSEIRPVSRSKLESLQSTVPAELIGQPLLANTAENALAWRCDASSYYYGGDFVRVQER